MPSEPTSFLHDESGAMRLGWLVLGTGLFAGAASLPGYQDQLSAQEAPVSAAIPAGPVSAKDQARLARAMETMDAAELSLTYARIHLSFRALLGHEDPGAARTLIDYATIAEAEMHRRRIARPKGTESASRMRLLFELVM